MLCKTSEKDTKESQVKNKKLLSTEFWKQLLGLSTPYQLWALRGMKNNDIKWDYKKRNWAIVINNLKIFEQLLPEIRLVIENGTDQQNITDADLFSEYFVKLVEIKEDNVIPVTPLNMTDIKKQLELDRKLRNPLLWANHFILLEKFLHGSDIIEKYGSDYAKELVKKKTKKKIQFLRFVEKKNSYES